MARVYLSCLGTSNYVPCTYCYGETRIADVRFVQEATTRIFCAGWASADRILIFTTQEAKRRNWNDGGYFDDAGKPIAGLDSRLASLSLKTRITAIDIPEGGSEAEIWQIFQIIYDHINEADQVVFDITHAFRSIPMLAMVVLPYARVMKNIRIQGIYYGAFEILGHPAKVKELPMDQRRAPIFDLTPFSALLDWTLAIDRFLGAGDAGPACDLANTAVRPILSETKGQDQAAAAIRQVAVLLGAFTKNISTCRGREITGIATRLRQALDTCHSQHLLLPLQPLLKRVRQKLEPFRDDVVHDGIQAARWCLDHNLIQQGYTILQETLITFFVLQAHQDPAQKKNRELASQTVTIFLNSINESNRLPPAAHHPEIVNKFMAFLQNNWKLAEIFRNLSQSRNDLNHAGFVSPRSADAFTTSLDNFIVKVEKVIS